MRARLVAALGFVALLAACGGNPSPSESTFSSTAEGVTVIGRVSDPGTKGSVLVFAYADLQPNEDPTAREPAAVGTVADGGFDLSVQPCPSMSLVFLVDRSHDGAIDAGDPTVVFSSPELVDLQPGDQVTLSDVAVDFHGHRATAAVEVARANAPAPAQTATPIPAQ